MNRPERNLLHKSKLNEFAKWCSEVKNVKTRPGKGQYQVLQVNFPSGNWTPIYEKITSTEHYTVPGILAAVVRNFIRETKEG